MSRLVLVTLAVSFVVDVVVLASISRTREGREITLGSVSLEAGTYDLRSDGRCLARFSLTADDGGPIAYTVSAPDAATASPAVGGMLAFNILGQLLDGEVTAEFHGKSARLVADGPRALWVRLPDGSRDIPIPILAVLHDTEAGEAMIRLEWLPETEQETPEFESLLERVGKLRLNKASQSNCEWALFSTIP